MYLGFYFLFLLTVASDVCVRFLGVLSYEKFSNFYLLVVYDFNSEFLNSLFYHFPEGLMYPFASVV